LSGSGWCSTGAGTSLGWIPVVSVAVVASIRRTLPPRPRPTSRTPRSTNRFRTSQNSSSPQPSSLRSRPLPMPLPSAGTRASSSTSRSCDTSFSPLLDSQITLPLGHVLLRRATFRGCPSAGRGSVCVDLRCLARRASWRHGLRLSLAALRATLPHADAQIGDGGILQIEHLRHGPHRVAPPDSAGVVGSRFLHLHALVVGVAH